MTGCKEIKLEWSAIGRMKIVFKFNIPLFLKKRGYDQCVLPVMTYGCETCMLNSKMSSLCALGKKYDQNGRYSRTHSEKNGWQMDPINTGMISKRM
jgi:hypothetical protein